MTDLMTTFVTLTVPSDAVDEFKTEWLRDAAFIAEQPGHEGNTLYKRSGGNGQEEFTNVAHWASQDDLSAALKAAVVNQHKEGRDQSALFKRLGISVSPKYYTAVISY